MRVGFVSVLTFAAALAPLADVRAQTPDRPWTEAQACLADLDPAICWLRGMVRLSGGGMLTSDPELGGRPDILMLAGAAAPTAAEAPDADVFDSVEPRAQPFFAAVDAAVAVARSGAEPEAVLAPLQALPVTGGYAMLNPVQEGVFSFGRLDAYLLMTTALMERGARTPDPERLVPAIMAAWEADLAGADEALLLGAGSEVLASLHASRGDVDGARRVLERLSPENEPALISGLVDLDLFAEAAAVSERADAARGLDRLRRRQALLEQTAAAQMAEFAEFQEAAFEEAFADLTAEQRASLLAGLADPEADEDPYAEDSADPDAILVETAEEELASARGRLLHEADRAGKAALVRSTARLAFDEAIRSADAFGSGARLAQALTLLAQTSEASEAVALIERAEAHAWTRTDSHLQLLLPAIHAAWLTLDRPERADALIEEWRPLAAAQGRAVAEGRNPLGVLSGDGQPGAKQGLQAILLSRDDLAGARALGWLSPDAGLRRDFAAGRGVSRLDDHLSGSTEDDQGQILISCRYLALEAGDPDAAAVCAERFADSADTPNRHAIAADGLLQIAGAAAMKDDVATAWRLTQRGLAMGREAERTESPALSPSFSLNVHLRDVAKAVLRRDGRLPPLPARGDTARGATTGGRPEEG